MRAGKLSGREHRNRNPALALLERYLDLLAAAHRVEVAIDDIGHHGHTFVELYVRDAVRDGAAAAGNAVGVHGPRALGLMPRHLVGEAEGADATGIVVYFTAIGAFLEQQLSLS